MSELDWGWGGLPVPATRASHAGPLLAYRRHLVEAGLLRTRGGMLLPSVKGRALRESPAGTVVASRALAFGLHMLDWRDGDGSPVSGRDAFEIVMLRLRVLAA